MARRRSISTADIRRQVDTREELLAVVIRLEISALEEKGTREAEQKTAKAKKEQDVRGRTATVARLRFGVPLVEMLGCCLLYGHGKPDCHGMEPSQG